MTSIVDIGMRVDSTSVKAGTKALDDFGNQAGRTSRATDNLTKVTDDFDTSLSKIVVKITSWTAVLASLYAAQALVRDILFQSIGAANEAAKSQARLEAVLKATGSAAGLTSKQLNEMADQMARSTLFDDEQIRDASAVMLSFRNVQGDTFREGLKLASDMSALFGGDLQSSVLQLGKALNDPTQGVTALSRAGITFSDTQEKQIKNFQETNQLLAAQRIVLDEVANQLGGTAEKMAAADNGAHRLRVSWNELLEAIGKTEKIGGGAKSIFNLLANSADALREAIEKSSRVAIGLNGKLQPLPGQDKFNLPSLGGDARLLNEEQSAARRAILDKQDLLTLKDRSESANKLKASYDALYDLEPQNKFFLDLAKIVEIEKVYGESLATNLALQKAANEFSASATNVVRGQFGGVEGDANEMERARELEASNAFTAQVTEQWAYREAEKSRVIMEGIEYRKAIEKASYDASLSLAADGLGALSSLFATGGKKAFEVSKALAIGQTIISTYAAAQKAYEAQLAIPDPSAQGRAVVAAGIAVISGLARVAAISRTSYGSKSSGSSAGGGGSVPSSGATPSSSGTTNQSAASAGQTGGQSQVLVTLIVNGAVTPAQLANEYLIPILQDRIKNNDLVIAYPGSRQHEELKVA